VKTNELRGSNLKVTALNFSILKKISTLVNLGGRKF
jgi:hypothetical protein